MSEQEVFDYIYSVITREYLENKIRRKRISESQQRISLITLTHTVRRSVPC